MTSQNKPFIQQLIWVCAGLSLLLAACGGDDASPTTSTAGGVVESSPVLTLDQEVLLGIRTVEDDSLESGIYAMDVDAPVRFQLVSGVNLTSPSLTPDGDLLMYLDSGQIHVLDLDTDSTSIFMEFFRFQSVAWLNNEVLLTELNGKLWAARWPFESSFTFLANGWDPTIIREAAIVYANAAGPGQTAVVDLRLDEINGTQPDIKVSSLSRVRFPSPHPEQDSQYLFSIDEDTAFAIAFQRGAENYRALTYSHMPRARFIDSVRFVYTGPDGLFWTFDVTDSTTMPYQITTSPR